MEMIEEFLQLLNSMIFHVNYKWYVGVEHMQEKYCLAKVLLQVMHKHCLDLGFRIVAQG